MKKLEKTTKKPQKRPKWLVWRPPSSALWVLYQNMIRIWKYLFTGATCCVLIGLLFLAYAVFKLNITGTIMFIAVVAVGSCLLWLFYKIYGPVLGAED